MLHETNHYTDSLSSDFIFIFSLFRNGYGSLWLGLSRLYGVIKIRQTVSLWATLGYCYVCCRPGCLTIFRWPLQATIFEDSLSLVLFWFYCWQLLVYSSIDPPSPPIHATTIRNHIQPCPSTNPDFSLLALSFFKISPLSCRLCIIFSWFNYAFKHSWSSPDEITPETFYNYRFRAKESLQWYSADLADRSFHCSRLMELTIQARGG